MTFREDTEALASMIIRTKDLLNFWVKNSDADGIWNNDSKAQFDTLMNAFMVDALSYHIDLASLIMHDAVSVAHLERATDFTKLAVWPRMIDELYPYLKDAQVSY